MSSTPPPIVLKPENIRAIALRAQRLAEDPAPFGQGKAAVLKAVEHLGYIQVDSISVLQRAHHHVLWSRIPDYQPAMLDELHSADAAVFEYWNHAASYLPTSGYRYSLPLMRKYSDRTHWGEETPELQTAMKRLLKQIRKSGALKISEVEGKTATIGWTEGSVSTFERRALHELWIRGDVMIRERHGIEKVFDLPERVLPSDTDRRMPKPKEAALFHVRRSLRALGVVRTPELHYLQDAASAASAKEALATLLASGEAVAVEMEGTPKPPLFALRSALEDDTVIERGAVRFLSPFDNSAIQRKRLKWLFDFDYTVEIYVPAAKRKFGYFVLPILWGDRLIGRLDAKADRKTGTLLIHNLVFESWFKDFRDLKAPFRKAMKELMVFQGCKTVAYARVEPASFRIF